MIQPRVKVTQPLHVHAMAVKHVEDKPDMNRPKWAGLYTGEKRYIIIDYCTGCPYSRARDFIDSDKLEERKR